MLGNVSLRLFIRSMVHDHRHHPSDHPDLDPDRGDSDLAAQPQLGLRSGRHRRRDPDHPPDPSADGADLAVVSEVVQG
jgi:hypothetical protein